MIFSDEMEFDEKNLFRGLYGLDDEYDLIGKKKDSMQDSSVGSTSAWGPGVKTSKLLQP